jgi:ABC-type nitrate/sulfonate/bicarbonate transport system substrate-binding protein
MPVVSRNRFVAGLCSIGLLVGAFMPSAAEAKPVVVGVVAPIGLFWPNFAALKRGFFDKENVQADLIFVGEVAAEVQQVIGGSLDVAYTTCEVAVKAIDKGADIRIVGETVRVYPYSIMSSPTVKTMADMKGKKVILAAQKDLLTAAWQHWVRDQGGNPKDIDEIYDGATPNRYSALANGAASGALVSQPFDFRAKSEGYFELLNYSAYLKDYAFVCAAARTDWVKQNPDLAKAYFRAMSNATAWLYDPANKEDAISVLVEVSKQDRGLITKTYDYYFNEIHPYSKGLAVEPGGMQKLLDTLKESHDIKPDMTYEKVTDTGYLPK